MRLIDMHCDTNLLLFEAQSQALESNALHVDLNKLRKADSLVQFFASFFELPATPKPYDHTMQMLQFFKTTLAPYKDFAVLENAKQLDGDQRLALLSVEEGGCMEGSVVKLESLYREGVRSITLTWNFENELGYTNLDAENRGLKPFGYEAVEAMNHLGMIIDVSHLSDRGTMDVIGHSRSPIIASHSNSRTLVSHTRNLTDELIRGIAGTGGVVGLNFWSALLGSSPTARIEDMVNHISHNIKVGGEDVVAIGTDYDGISNALDIANIGEMHLLERALRQNGFSERQIEKLFYQNALRVLKTVLKEA